MDTFVLAMDDYFEIPRVIHALRKVGIGWPSKDLHAITQQESNFNEFIGALMNMAHYLEDVHKVGGMVERVKRRTRITVLNKKYVKDVWGDMGEKGINIPR
eukprot:7945018-Ditylum_brightwellii.AAC.1